MSGFFPVDRGLFSSSTWLNGSTAERCLWIWLLGNRDDEGVVRHRELAIADGAKLSREDVEAGLAKFEAPDPDSRTRDNEGRRIARTDDGFVRILNHELYYSKDYSTPRWRRWKERQRTNALANAPTPLATKDKDKDTDKDKDNKKQTPAPVGASSARADVVRVFDHWKTTLNHPKAKLDGKRRRLIETRLRDFTADELCSAIDGCRLSDFHMGANDAGKRYDGLQTILRDAEQVEKFAVMGAKTAPTKAGTFTEEEAWEAGQAATRRALAAASGARS